MQRPRLIATGPVCARALELIATDPQARREYDGLIVRIETIFDMTLLSYGAEPVAPPITLMSPIVLPADVPTEFALPISEPEASPLDFLPSVGSFEPAPLPAGRHLGGGMILQALGFEPKGFSANEIAKAALSRLQALGLAWQLTQDQKYAKRGIDEMMALCALPHWGKQFLATATIMQALAIGYDWLHDQMSAAQRATVIEALIEMGLAPALAAFDSKPQPNWIRLSNNWNIVCNASIIMTALAIGPDVDDPRVGRAKELALSSLGIGLELLDRDGSWRLEGPGYWHLATEHLTYLLASLATVGEELPAGFDTSGIEATGDYRCYMSGPTNALFNFGDSPERRPGLWWLRWLGSRYGRAHYHEIAEDRTGASGAAPEIHPMDVIWRRPSPPAPAPSALASLPTVAVFCETAVMRSAWGDPKAAYVGIKGGETSGRRSHTHLDLGHFVYEIGGVRWAIDLEPDEYSDCYLAPPERYKFYRANTHGHNALVIEGHDQVYTPFGDPAPPVAATFSQPIQHAGATSIAIDLSAAYPDTRSVRRTFTLEADGSLTIVDEIAVDKPISNVVWSLHTRAAVYCSGNRAELESAAGDGQPELVLRAELQGVDGAVFEALPAGADAPHAACEMTEAPSSDITRLAIRIGEVRADLRLTVRLSLDRH